MQLLFQRVWKSWHWVRHLLPLWPPAERQFDTPDLKKVANMRLISSCRHNCIAITRRSSPHGSQYNLSCVLMSREAPEVRSCGRVISCSPDVPRWVISRRERARRGVSTRAQETRLLAHCCWLIFPLHLLLLPVLLLFALHCTSPVYALASCHLLNLVLHFLWNIVFLYIYLFFVKCHLPSSITRIKCLVQVGDRGLSGSDQPTPPIFSSFFSNI